MLHMTKTAVSTATDLGEFEALVATYDLDRQGDRIEPGAFAATIAQWKSTGRMLPLHWNHSSSAADIIGYVDPASMAEGESGLVVSGRVDIETDRGREVWRLLKANSVAFSFGYLATGERELSDGTRLITAVDLYEVSVTPEPANPNTRVLATKAGDDIRTAARAQMLRVLTEPEPVPTLDDLRARTKALRVDELARKAQPIQIASFEC